MLNVTKGMNPRKIILITCLILSANQLKAQILKSEMLSAGISHQIGLSNNTFSQTGPKMSLSHLRYAVNTGVLFSNDKDFSTFFINGEFNVLAWHHAYVAHRFTPVLGAQLERTSRENTKSSLFFLKLGLKVVMTALFLISLTCRIETETNYKRGYLMLFGLDQIVL